MSLISCDQDHEQEKTHTEESNEKDIRLIKAFKESGIPMDSSVILFLPPTSCKACIIGVADVIDSFPNAFIYYASINEDDKIEKQPTQTYVPYDRTTLLKNGIMRYYAELILVKDGKIVQSRVVSKKK